MNRIFHITISDNLLINILVLGITSLVLSMLITPIFTSLAYKYEWWKKPRKDAWSGGTATVYNKIHAAKHRRNIPNMAGIIFVVSVAIITLLLNLKRDQTWLPLAGMVGAGLIGLVDDIMNIKGVNYLIAGMQAKLKFFLYSVVAFIGGWWFYYKLNVSSFYLPYFHNIHVGIFIIIIFWFVVIATANSVNITDGLDGLAGGLLSSSFAGYALISAVEHKYALAAFCITVVGALLSYTWFNIFPARFFMGDVGSFALGTALGIIAMQTNTIYVLPIIGIVYVFETGSVIINRTSKLLRHGKKVFLSSPIHHHFEAIGWPETKITMRFWILGQAATFVGLVVFLLGRR
jgi:phospho-N-acetylmuramoyl-pentapeptide-transferase